MTVDQRNAQVRAWTEEVLGAVGVAFGPPGSGSGGARVCFHLLDMAPEPPAHANREQRLQATLRYLVTAVAESPEAAARMIQDLLFAAMENGQFEVDLPPPPGIWLALGVPPQPSLVLSTAVWKELPAGPVRLTRDAILRFSIGRVTAGNGSVTDGHDGEE